MSQSFGNGSPPGPQGWPVAPQPPGQPQGYPQQPPYAQQGYPQPPPPQQPSYAQQPGYPQQPPPQQPPYAQPGYPQQPPAQQTPYAQPGYPQQPPAQQTPHAQQGYPQQPPAQQPPYAQPGYPQQSGAQSHAFGAPLSGQPGFGQPQPFGAPQPLDAANPLAGLGMHASNADSDDTSLLGMLKSGGVKARLRGLGLIGLGVLALAVNGYTLYASNEYYPKVLFFAPVLLLIGAWGVIVGEPIDKNTGRPATWGQFGNYALGGLGVVLGIAAIALVGC